MATLTYVYEDTVMLVDDGVIEIFNRVVTGSGRTPLVWAGVKLTPKRGDKIRVAVGTAATADARFYSDDISETGPFGFEVPASEEKALRAFFDEAARRAGRFSR